ncbi:YiiD C-terminal domain-containing protein [Legionella sp. km772]|uniref:YiiD C-terminal domain-containing protein n=1 Tax=Legionella sp. km772 TaxID=2498111 RepID=UPI000F8E46D6|nr:YiiD C-terminal domain-containing protein [Legionella sp. km772]RUR07511.1 DUF4442 domain-containing protein [Legionella sp. km772]
MKLSTLLKLIRFWPPFLGAGIKVKSFNEDYSMLTVQMKLRFWNKNYVGTHFGGSLYSMTDPFYMLLLLHALGKGYIVWDKSASIRYKKPARNTVFAEFKLSTDLIETIKNQLETAPKTEAEFLIEIKDQEGDVVAEIKKTLHINKKIRQANGVD